MAGENLLTDATVKAALLERDGAYLRDGGGLRIRLLPPSRKHKHGARLCEYMFNLRQDDGTYKSAVIGLGTIGEDFTAITIEDGKEVKTVRPFTLADARKARDAARTQVKAGHDPRDVRRLEQLEAVEKDHKRLVALEVRRTFKEVFEDWEKAALKHIVLPNGKSIGRNDDGKYVREQFERRVFPRVGALPFVEVGKAHVLAIQDAAKAEGKISTANMILADLKQMYKYAALRDIIESSPIELIQKLPGEEARQRVLNEAELKELYRRLPLLPERIGHILPLILSTAVRVGELSAAEVKHFDLEKKEWRIPAANTKTQSAHLVHLSDHAIRHVKALIAMRGQSIYLLPRRDADGSDGPIDSSLITKAVADRQRARPIKGRTPDADALTIGEKFTPHDLRRTAATTMRERLRVSSDVVERVLNHVPPKLIGTYQVGQLLDERREAFTKWGEILDKLLFDDALPRVRPTTRRAS